MKHLIGLVLLALTSPALASFTPLANQNFSYGVIEYNLAPQIMIRYQNSGSTAQSISNPILPSQYKLSINRCSNIAPNKTCYIILTPSNIQPSESPLTFSVNGASISMTLYIKNAQGQLVPPSSLVSSSQFKITSHSGSVDFSFDNPLEVSKTVQIVIQNTGTSNSTPQVQFSTNPSNARIMLNRCTTPLLTGKSCTISYLIPRPANDSSLSQNLTILKNSAVQDTLIFNINGQVTLTPDISFSDTMKNGFLGLSADQKTLFQQGSPTFSWHSRWVYLSRRLPTDSGKHYIEYIVKNSWNAAFGGNFTDGAAPTVYGHPFSQFSPAGPFIYSFVGSTSGSNGVYQGGLTKNWESTVETRVMVAYDFVNKKVWIGTDGQWESGENPATNQGGTDISLAIGSNTFFYPAVGQNGGSVEISNFPRYRPVGFQKMVSQAEQAVFDLTQSSFYSIFDTPLTPTVKTVQITVKNIGNKPEIPSIQLGTNSVGAQIISNQCNSALAILAECVVTVSVNRPLNNQESYFDFSVLRNGVIQDTSSILVRGYVSETKFMSGLGGGNGVSYSPDGKTVSIGNSNGVGWTYVDRGVLNTSGKYYAEVIMNNVTPRPSASTYIGGQFFKENLLGSNIDKSPYFYGFQEFFSWIVFGQNPSGCGSYLSRPFFQGDQMGSISIGNCGDLGSNPIFWDNNYSRVMLAIDFDLKKLWIGVNGQYKLGDDPATGAGGFDISSLISTAHSMDRYFFYLGISAASFNSPPTLITSLLVNDPLYIPQGFENLIKTTEEISGNLEVVDNNMNVIEFAGESILSTTLTVKNTGSGNATPNLVFNANGSGAFISSNQCSSVLPPNATCSLIISSLRPLDNTTGTGQLLVYTKSVQTGSMNIIVKGQDTLTSRTFFGSNQASVFGDQFTFSSDQKTMTKLGVPKSGSWWSYLSKGVPSSHGKYYLELEVSGNILSFIGGAFQQSPTTTFIHPIAENEAIITNGYTYSNAYDPFSHYYEYVTINPTTVQCVVQNTGPGSGRLSVYKLSTNETFSRSCGDSTSNPVNWQTTIGTSKRLMVALDFDNKKMWIGADGIWGNATGLDIEGIINYSRNQGRTSFYLGAGFMNFGAQSSIADVGSIQIVDNPLYMPSGYIPY